MNETIHTNPFTGAIYTRGNHDILSHAMHVGGYTTSEWATLRAWNENGYKVKKGTHGVQLKRVIRGTVSKKDKDGDVKSKSAWGIKFFTVFNREQVEKRSAQECTRCHGTLGENPEKSLQDGRTLICNQCATCEKIERTLAVTA